MTINARDVARAFHALMASALSLTDRQEVDRLNADPAYTEGWGCASQDLIDANMIMLSAFEACGVDVVDANNAEHAAAWNAAWDLAQGNGFSRKWGA